MSNNGKKQKLVIEGLSCDNAIMAKRLHDFGYIQCVHNPRKFTYVLKVEHTFYCELDREDGSLIGYAVDLDNNRTEMKRSYMSQWTGK